jgi:hypothetical protein
MTEGDERRSIELDRVAWNLPTPPPEEVHLPAAENWPPWPFPAADDGARGERIAAPGTSGQAERLGSRASRE